MVKSGVEVVILLLLPPKSNETRGKSHHAWLLPAFKNI